MKKNLKFYALMLVSLSIFVTYSNTYAEETSESPYIVNFHNVTKDVPQGITIYRGARLTDQASVSFLAGLGIKTVIDLQGGDVQLKVHGASKNLNKKIDKDVPLVEKGETPQDIAREKAMVTSTLSKDGKNMTFYSMPLNSINGITPQESKRIDDILKIMNDKAQQPVYVHCAHGADRTGLIVALFRVTNNQLSPEDAKDEMQELGHNWGHYVFTHEMDEYFNSYIRQNGY